MVDDSGHDAERSACIAEARRIEEDATYSAKGHYNSAEWWQRWHMGIGISAAVLSVVAGVSALASFPAHDVVSAVAAFTVASLTSIATFLNPAEKASAHHRAGTGFTALRDTARHVANLRSPRDTLAKLREDVRALASKKAELNAAAPPIRPGAYVKARQGITRGESAYSVDLPRASE